MSDLAMHLQPAARTHRKKAAGQDKQDLTAAFLACIREVAFDLGYEIAKEPGGSETIAYRMHYGLYGRTVELLLIMEFHGSTIVIPVILDPVGWGKKTSSEIDAYFAWERTARSHGCVPFHFTKTEIAQAPMLCADQVINAIIDFQSATIHAAASGAA